MRGVAYKSFYNAFIKRVAYLKRVADTPLLRYAATLNTRLHVWPRILRKIRYAATHKNTYIATFRYAATRVAAYIS